MDKARKENGTKKQFTYQMSNQIHAGYGFKQ